MTTTAFVCSELLESIGVHLSHDAQFYLKKLIEVLQLPILFPKYKDEYEVLFKKRENIGLIIDEWKRCVSQVQNEERYLPIVLSLKLEIYVYMSVEYRSYDLKELDQCMKDLNSLDSQLDHLKKNLLVCFLNLYGYILVVYCDQYEEALQYFNRALELDSSVVHNLVCKADCYYRLHRYEEALKEYNQVLSSDPSSAIDHYENRARVYQAMKSYEEAIEDYTQAIELNKRSPVYLVRLHMQRGNCYDALHRYPEACADYNKVVELDDKNTYACFALGYIHLTYLRMYDIAVQHFTRAIHLNPKYARAYLYRGNAFRKLGLIDKAVEDYETTLSINYSFASAWHNLAFTYDKKGQVEEAIKYYTKAIEINPNMLASWYNIGYIHFEQGRYVKALYYIQKAHCIGHDHWYSEQYQYLKSLLRDRSAGSVDLFHSVPIPIPASDA